MTPREAEASPEGGAGGRALLTINRAITTLVQQAPQLDRTIADGLITELRAIDDAGAPLAGVIARVVALLLEQRCDQGIALPALAMACATLGDFTRGTLGLREVEAARYEIETLLPVPGPPPPKLVTPDVPIIQLTRGRPPRT